MRAPGKIDRSSVTVQLRCSAEEREQYIKAAEREGRTVSNWLRTTLNKAIDGLEKE